MQKWFKLVLVSTIMLITGCASIVSGHHQSVTVKTGEIHGATCTLTNNKGIWYVNQTPGSVMVHKSYANLDVSCQKHGTRLATVKVKSNTKPIAFGNILIGGVVGAGIDVASGAAYEYPQEINVPLS